MSTNFTISAFLPVPALPRTSKKILMRWTNSEVPLTPTFDKRSLGNSKRSRATGFCLKRAKITTNHPCFNALYPVGHSYKCAFLVNIVCLFLKQRKPSDSENLVRLPDSHILANGRTEFCVLRRDSAYVMIQSSCRHCMSNAGTVSTNPEALI